MKCITNGKITRRVPDKEAAEEVATGKWKYCTKRFWKKENESVKR